jgi:hypothetical protein
MNWPPPDTKNRGRGPDKQVPTPKQQISTSDSTRNPRQEPDSRSDEEIEREIADARDALLAAWERMRHAIGQRSSDRVRAMELDRGLR